MSTDRAGSGAVPSAGASTPLEEVIRLRFAEVLHEPVSVQDDFFELGGDVLGAMQVLSRLHSAGIELSFPELFQRRTAEGCAELLRERARPSGSTVALRPTDRSGELPLSYSQQRVWLVERLARERSPYQVQSTIRFRGDLSVDALRAALSDLVRRHESLRTVFVERDHSVVQQVLEPWAVPLPLVDLRDVGDSEAALAALLEEQFVTTIRVDTLPLVNWTLARTRSDEHVLITVEHHYLHDGWSLSVFVRELFEMYDAHVLGRPSVLPPMTIQYGDFAVWQRERAAAGEFEPQLEYWRAQLANVPPIVAIPSDRPRQSHPRHRGASERVFLDPALIADLKAASIASRMTLFMTMCAGFVILMSRMSGQRDVCIGTSLANRDPAEVEGLIGMILNNVVLRIDLSDDPPLNEVLDRVRRRTLEAYENQDVPFEQVVEAVNPTRMLAANPLFQSMFSFHDAPMPTAPPTGLSVELREGLNNGTAKFDMNVVAIPRSSAIGDTRPGCLLLWEYDVDLFDRETIQRLIGHYEQILRAIVGDPAIRPSEIALTPTRLSGPPLSRTVGRAAWSVGERVSAVAARRGGAVAVRSATASATYGWLDTAARRVAGWLGAAGVRPGDAVGVCGPRCIDLVVGALGAMQAGAAYVPLDAAYPVEALRYQVKDAGAKCVLTAGPEAAAAMALLGVPAVPVAEARRSGVTRAGARVRPEMAAYVIYTSGSTGRPKGTVVTHGGLTNYLAWVESTVGAGPGTTVPLHTGITFDMAVTSLWLPLVSGGTLVLVPEAPGVAPLAAVMSSRLAWTLVKVTPSHLLALEDWLRPERVRAQVGTLFIGGEALSAEMLAPWRTCFPESTILNEYGPTETVVGSVAYRVPTTLTDGPVPIGEPITETRVAVVDPEGRAVPTGAIGELVIGGAGVSAGYVGRAALTAARFGPDADGAAGDRRYWTGDRVRLRADNQLEYLGRADDQVKLRGYRIELGEIDAAMRNVAGVQEAATILEKPGAPMARLVAYARAVVGASAEAIEAELRPLLPPHMVPRVRLIDTWPLTPSGKVDRAALAAFPAGAPAPARTLTPLEEVVAENWRGLLGCADISPTTNFFELGGHSVLAARSIARLERTFSTTIPLTHVFMYPILADFAAALQRSLTDATGRTLPALRPVANERPPLSHGQQQIWLLSQFAVDTPLYHVVRGFHLEGRLDVPTLARSLRAVIARHHPLRTVIRTSDVGPFQDVLPCPEEPLKVVDVGNLPPERRPEVAAEIGRTDAWTPFDLSSDLPIRATLVRHSQSAHTLWLTIHHIAIDGWSLGVLYRELSVLYNQGGDPLTAGLASLQVSYADYAVWQRQIMEGDPGEAGLAFWRDELEDAPALVEWPQHRDVFEDDWSGGIASRDLPARLLDALDEVHRRDGITPFMTTLTAFGCLLNRYYGFDDIVIGVPMANRRPVELEQLVGLFVNPVVLRLRPSGRRSFAELLQDVRRTTIDAFARAEVPFERIVEALHLPRAGNRNPLFQIAFAYQNVPQQDLALADVISTPVSVEMPTSRFDLSLSLTPVAGCGLKASLEYSSRILDPPTAEAWLASFEALIESALADPSERVAKLSTQNLELQSVPGRRSTRRRFTVA